MKRRTDGKGKPKKKKQFGGRRSKFCKFCVEKSTLIDYKDVKTLQGFTPVRPASAHARGSHQARPQHRAAALRDGLDSSCSRKRAAFGRPALHSRKGRRKTALSRDTLFP